MDLISWLALVLGLSWFVVTVFLVALRADPDSTMGRMVNMRTAWLIAIAAIITAVAALLLVLL